MRVPLLAQCYSLYGLIFVPFCLHKIYKNLEKYILVVASLQKASRWFLHPGFHALMYVSCLPYWMGLTCVDKRISQKWQSMAPEAWSFKHWGIRPTLRSLTLRETSYYVTEDTGAVLREGTHGEETSPLAKNQNSCKYLCMEIRLSSCVFL